MKHNGRIGGAVAGLLWAVTCAGAGQVSAATADARPTMAMYEVFADLSNRLADQSTRLAQLDEQIKGSEQ